MLGHWYTLLLLQPPAAGQREVWRGDSPIVTQINAASAIVTQLALQSGIDIEEVTP